MCCICNIFHLFLAFMIFCTHLSPHANAARRHRRSAAAAVWCEKSASLFAPSPAVPRCTQIFEQENFADPFGILKMQAVETLRIFCAVEKLRRRLDVARRTGRGVSPRLWRRLDARPCAFCRSGLMLTPAAANAVRRRRGPTEARRRRGATARRCV